MNNRDIRLGIANEIRQEYIEYSGVFIDKVRQMLETAGNMQHAPRKILPGKYCNDADSAEIAECGALHDLQAC